MCRMLGVVSQGPVYYDLFEEFADLATHGMCPLGAPDERGHKDGWGLACFENGTLALRTRDVGSAADSSKYYGSAWKIAKRNFEREPGHSLIVMGHLRRASVKSLVDQEFSQPFVQDCDGVIWAFQHNGSLKGETGTEEIDSQVLFRTFLDVLDGRDHRAVMRATRNARETVIERFGSFSSLNFMLSDGRALHVYRDFEANGGYYTIYLDNFGEMVLAVSEPILAMKAEPVPRGILHSITPDLTIQRTTIS